MTDVTMKTESANNQGQTAAASGAPQIPQPSPLEVSNAPFTLQLSFENVYTNLLSDMQAGKAETIALNTHAALNTAAMPVRQYLEATVVPVLMSGLGQVVRERPSDPVEYLAAYLLKHNPQQQQQQSAGQASKPS